MYYNLKPVAHRHCEDCEDLFMLASMAGFNSKNFVDCWMKSEECKNFDGKLSRFHTSGAPFILEYLCETYEDKFREPGEVLDKKYMSWMGGIYRYWAIREHMSSKEVYKLCSYELMKKLAPSLSLEDPDTAIDVIKLHWLGIPLEEREEIPDDVYGIFRKEEE